ATPEILECLASLLQDGYENVREAAARAVGALGAAAATPEILARLASLLQDGDEDVRRAAAWAVGALQEKGLYLFASGGVWQARPLGELTE
ncbi:MAG: HEAT repeat domain-containing protein, partial [Chloroflexi bacterium]|nr:HEAT repeat domain-containing protein [Chloroflexota bacterium]